MYWRLILGSECNFISVTLKQLNILTWYYFSLNETWFLSFEDAAFCLTLWCRTNKVLCILKRRLNPSSLCRCERRIQCTYRVMRPRTLWQEANIWGVHGTGEILHHLRVLFDCSVFPKQRSLVNKEKCLLVFYSRVQITICVRIANVLSKIYLLLCWTRIFATFS